jgi:hypothetical protein
MWDAGPGEHPDEGTIHAWLDGALDDASAERVAAHVRTAARRALRWRQRRAADRGASRVVSALDDAGGDATGLGAERGQRGAVARTASGVVGEMVAVEALRVTAPAAIAATILVALGVTLTHALAMSRSSRWRRCRPVIGTALLWRGDRRGGRCRTGGAAAEGRSAGLGRGAEPVDRAGDPAEAGGKRRFLRRRRAPLPGDAPAAVAEQRVASADQRPRCNGHGGCRPTAAGARRGDGRMAARAADEVAVAARRGRE